MQYPKYLLLGIPIAMGSCTGSGSAGYTPDRLNIIFIFSDDHATHAIGAYGPKNNNPDLHKHVYTPAIDRLAFEGMLLTAGKVGVPQGGPFSPIATDIYLNDLDLYFDGIRRKIAEGNNEAVNYHRCADDIVITVNGLHTKSGWDDLALRRFKEQLVPLGVTLNEEKTQLVDILKGDPFSFLRFDFRQVANRQRTGHFILLTPKKKARIAMKAKIREIINNGGATPAKEIISRINVVLAGWVNYFRAGNSSLAFSEVRDYLEMKVRTLLARRRRRKKCSVGWRRWSTEYLYGVLGLFWDWNIRPLGNVDVYM